MTKKLLTAVVVFIFLLFAFSMMRRTFVGKGPAGKAGILTSTSLTTSSLNNAIVNVYEKVGAAVVTISTERTQKPNQHNGAFGGNFNNGNFFKDDPMRRFFEYYFGQPQKEFKQRGLGSGFIMDEAGHILTNNHVVSEVDKITVTLPDGRTFEGQVKGSDARSDLAVVKIKGDKLPVIKMGNSDKLRTGEWVVALGNPFGNILKSPHPTVTAGVISALHRQIPSGTRESLHLDMIQTDAAINPGNSGGPLCNLNGEVIGINVAIFSTSGGYEGVGFAIPVNVAKSILNDLIVGRDVSYGWFGVLAQDITDQIAEYFNLSDEKGVLISKVYKDSPAERAGIKEGDIILAFGNTKLDNTYDLVDNVSKAKPGSVIKVRLIRDRVLKNIPVTIGEYPGKSKEMSDAGKGKTSIESNQWRGIKVTNITDEIAAQLSLEDKKGVVVTYVDSRSPFYAVGLKRGDVLKEINRNPVNSIEDFNKVTSQAHGNALMRTGLGYFVVESD